MPGKDRALDHERQSKGGQRHPMVMPANEQNLDRLSAEVLRKRDGR
jgi:hypothetical protein